jgi:hypothetical protein
MNTKTKTKILRDWLSLNHHISALSEKSLEGLIDYELNNKRRRSMLSRMVTRKARLMSVRHINDFFKKFKNNEI